MQSTSRNFRLGVYNGVLYNLSEAFLDPTLVLVAYLSQLTKSPVVLGLILPIRDGSWYLPQLWVSGFLQSIPRKIDIYRKLSYVRIAMWGTLAIVVNFFHNPSLIVPAFFAAYAVASLASGLSGLPFMEVVGKTIPAERRGEFYAWRFGLGGFFSIGASLIVRWLIDPNGPLPYPANYGVLAVAYFVFGSCSLLLYNGVKEEVDLVVKKSASFLSQLRHALVFLKCDLSYRQFLVMQSMITIGGMATPFFAVYVQQSLGGSKAMVGVYLGITMVTNLLSNIFFGRMSRRFGNRQVMLASSGTGIALSGSVLLLALLARPLHISSDAASLALIPVFILSGIRNTGIGVSANSLMLDLAPVPDRSLYLGFSNTFAGIVILSTSIGGVIMGWLGFQVLVIITLCAHLIAFLSARRICQIHLIKNVT